MSSLLRTSTNLLRAEDGLGARLFADVKTYASLGPHRAGTLGDAKTIDWLQASLDSSQWSVTAIPSFIEPFAEYDGCDLLIDGQPHECFGVWLPNNTAIHNVRAARASKRINLTDLLAVVDVASPTLGAHGAGQAIAAAISRGAAAVAVFNHLAPTDDSPLAALNSPPPYNTRQWSVPVAVIGSRARAALLTSSSALVNTLHIRGHCCGRGYTRSLIASHRLASPSTSPPVRLLVSTPISGWLAAGGERGVGVALWLFLARELPSLLTRLRAQQDLPTTAIEVLLLATNLHELGYGGARSLINTVLTPRGFTPNTTALWISLGASIITHQQGSNGIFRANIDYTHPSLTSALQPYRTAGFQPTLNPPDRRGELLPIAQAGYKAFGFYGEHAAFHTPIDYANSTSPELLELVARPTLRAIEEVVKEALVKSKPGRTRPPLRAARDHHDEPQGASQALLALLLAGVALAQRRRQSRTCTVVVLL